MKFKAYAVTNEFDLNKIASQCNLPRKYTWEEPLILQERSLAEIFGRKVARSKQIMVFAFGSIVFINTAAKDEQKFIEYLKTIKTDLDEKSFQRYSDDYELREEAEWQKIGASGLVFTDQFAVVPKVEVFHPELIAIVIAKSVALEKTEEQVGTILDKLEGMVERLEKANLRISDRELARTTAKIIRYEYTTVNYIMILDKPDITWTNSDAAFFYDQMADFFELNDRFEILKKKTDILNVIIGHFSSISHSLRGLFLEWLIVVLVLAEVVLMIVDLLK